MGLLHENATARHLALLRMWVFGMWIGDLLKDPSSDLAQIPLAYYQPVGILQGLPISFWEAALSEPLLQIWWGALAVLLLLSAAGVPGYRGVALVTCVLLTFYQGVIFGFTSVSHGPIAALYIAWILAVFPSADAFSLRRSPKASSNHVYQAAILTATILLLVTYMFVGVRRVVDGGTDIFLDGSILRFLARNSVGPDHLPQRLGLRVLEYPGLSTMFEVGFVIVTFFEIFSLLCLSSNWFRRSWLAVMLPFHVLSWPLLQLLFVHNILLICVLLIDLDGIAERLGMRRRLGIAPLMRGT
jgi:hypothetical protein